MITPPASTSALLTKVLYLILLLVTVAVLYFAREVFIPLALALLFSFLLTPLVSRFERWKIPRIPAVLLTALLAFAAIGGVGLLVVNQLLDLTYKLPSYRQNISHRIAELKSNPNSPLAAATETVKQLGEELNDAVDKPAASPGSSALPEGRERAIPVQIVEPATSLPKLLRGIFGPVLGPLGTAAVVIVFVIFMLLKREDLRDRIIHLIGRGQINVTTQALDEAAAKVTGYLTMQVIINVSFGVPIGIGLYFIGVPNAFLWGLLATILRFIPYLGAWLSLAFPLMLSLAVTDTWQMPIATLVLFTTMELISNNVLEPWLYGAHTGLSPVAILVATVFWTWLWGGVGLLLATPLTVCVAVLGKYIPSLRFLDALLGDEPTLAPNDRFYQRLLARDRVEATQVAELCLKETSLAEVYSSVFVPALAMAEREEERGMLDERQQRFVFDTIRELIEELGGEPPATAETPAPAGVVGVVTAFLNGGAKDEEAEKAAAADAAAPRVPVPAAATLSRNTVFCLPAVDEADELVALMLAQILEREGYKAEALSYKTLANEVTERVAESRTQTVCISATPPHDTQHTRYLCKRLTTRLPHLHIVAGLWDSDMEPDRLERRRNRLGVEQVATSMLDALERLRPLAALDNRAVEETEAERPVAAAGR